MVRLVILLLSRRWGLIIVGIILVIAGLAWGMTSKQVSYVNSNNNTTYRIGTGEQSGNVYIHADGSDEYYAAFASDFSVPQSDIDNSKSISFVARNDTSSLDPALNAPDGTTIHDAHKIEKLVFYDSNGAIMNTYTSDEYKANPNGFYDNQWLKSIWLTIGGAVLLLLVLLFSRRAKTQSATAGFSMGANGPQQPYGYGQPYQQPNSYVQPEQPTNPYGQSYQGPAQYPQATPYPPQQSPYGQPGNPYQQPPQS